MGKLLKMDIFTTVDLPVERVCESAKECTEVLIIGRTADGKPYYASSYSDGHRHLWELERFKHKLVRGDFE
jgi:hypothetical protein